MFNAIQSIMQSKIIGSVLLGLFMIGLFGSLFFALAVTSGEVMDNHCLFAQDAMSECAMNAQDHIAAWHTMFSFVVPLIFALMIIVVVMRVVPKIRVQHLHFIHYIYTLTSRVISTKQLEQLCYAWFYRPLQDLFSRGILHPIVYG